MTVVVTAYGPPMTRWHPWRALRSMADVEVVFDDLPEGVLGTTRGRRVTIANGLLQGERRATASHEAIHLERGHGQGCNPAAERSVEEESARRLITLPALADALCWAHDEWEVADECWVDVQTVRTRIDTLTSWEQAYIERRIAAREGAA